MLAAAPLTHAVSQHHPAITTTAPARSPPTVLCMRVLCGRGARTARAPTAIGAAAALHSFLRTFTDAQIAPGWPALAASRRENAGQTGVLKPPSRALPHLTQQQLSHLSGDPQIAPRLFSLDNNRRPTHTHDGCLVRPAEPFPQHIIQHRGGATLVSRVLVGCGTPVRMSPARCSHIQRVDGRGGFPWHHTRTTSVCVNTCCVWAGERMGVRGASYNAFG
jgi:hypothetical protein